MADYDLLGNIAIIKNEKNGKKKKRKQKIEEAKALLNRSGIKTVVEKASDVSGRLRTIKTKHLAGKKTLVSEYKENNCSFKFNIETCYFSPRLANERQLISQKVERNDNVLVMFAGVGVYPIVISKYKKPAKIVGIELGKECCRYFKENLKLNRIPDGKIDVIQGDVKKKINFDFIKKNGLFDVVIMARPNLKESFLKWGLMACKKGTRLYYYGFCRDEDLKKMIRELEEESDKLGRKIKIIDSVMAGEIAPYKHRFRIEIVVLD